jgi:hypothetical protein
MKWNSAWILLVALGLFVFVIACEDDGGDSEGTSDIGEACSCIGDACEVKLGEDSRPIPAPDPEAVTFVGCDPDSITGAATSCFLSYEGQLGPTTYTEDGYCAVSSTRCEGNDALCPTAEYGDYNAHVECPEGMVMLETITEMTSPVAMTIHSKICVVSCTAEGDCRSGYECLDKDGVLFCYDDRNFSGDYTATQF